VGLVLASAPALSAQTAGEPRVALDLRGGLNVPTFNIADVAKAGPGFGAGVNLKVAERVWLIGDADFGFHSGADLAGGAQGPDVNVNHYMVKIGYAVAQPAGSRLSLVLNAGAGLMTFAVDGGSTFTYPGINVGAKLVYDLGGRFSFLLSPQGDIAFSKTAEVGTSNAWVWPVSAGLRVRF
jgi:hypothetical protein